MQLAFASRQLSCRPAWSTLIHYSTRSTRYYATTNPVLKQERKPAVFLGRVTSNKREDKASPLSPLARVQTSKSEKHASKITVKEGSQTPDNSGKRKQRKPQKERITPSKTPRGVSSSRKLLITPSTPRVSRIPVWSRPASVATRNLEKKKAPTGKAWSEHRADLKSKYPERWNPTKKISREAMQALRELHKADPEKYPSWVLAQRFKISPEAARRILKSTWTMSEERKEEKVMKERKTRIERMKQMREEEMHQMVRAGIKLKVHPDDRLELK